MESKIYKIKLECIIHSGCILIYLTSIEESATVKWIIPTFSCDTCPRKCELLRQDSVLWFKTVEKGND